MTELQTTALAWSVAIIIIALLFVMAWFEFHRPARLTPEEVAETIAALLNEHQMFMEEDRMHGGIRVFKFPDYWDADNQSNGDRITSMGQRQ
jgi:hypothetical protein